MGLRTAMTGGFSVRRWGSGRWCLRCEAFSMVMTSGWLAKQGGSWFRVVFRW